MVQIHCFFCHWSFFFEEINGGTFQKVSLKGKLSAVLLKNKVILHFQERQPPNSIIFMQEIPRLITTILMSIFEGNRFLSHSSLHKRSPRSSDLNLVNSGYVTYLNSHVYRDQPKSLAQQKAAKCHHISGINSEMIFNASQGIFHSLTSVLISNEGHFEKL